MRIIKKSLRPGDLVRVKGRSPVYVVLDHDGKDAQVITYKGEKKGHEVVSLELLEHAE